MSDALPTRPKLRDSVLLWQEGEDTLHFVLSASRQMKSFEMHPGLVGLVPLVDGTRTLDELEGCLGPAPDLGPADVEDVLRTLCAEGLATGADDVSLPDGPTGRYDRQLRLFAELPDLLVGRTPSEVQDEISQATVTVLGLGGAGAVVTSALAAAGVGTLRLCDADVVETSNLNRQLTYTTSDVGHAKAEACARWIAQLNPEVRAVPMTLELGSASDVQEAVSGSHVVVNCADRPSINVTSDWVSAACDELGIAYVVAGGYAYDAGTIGPSVVPGRSTCWACARAATDVELVAPEARLLRGPVRPTGSMAMIAGVLGHLAAWEALRLVVGVPGAMEGRLGEVDFWTLDVRWRTITPRPGCPCRGDRRNGVGR